MTVEYEEYDETVTYIEFDGGRVSKENLVRHLAHYESMAKYEVLTIGSLTDDIGELLHREGIVEPWTRQDTAPHEMPSFGGGERVGWKDNNGKAKELYRELTVEDKTYKIRLGGRLEERADTERDAQHAKAILERRNPDARVTIDVETDRVME